MYLEVEHDEILVFSILKIFNMITIFLKILKF